MLPSHLTELRNDERFVALLTLARATNSLRALLTAGLEQGPKDGTFAERQRASFLFLTASALHEVRQLFQQLGKHFRESEAYQTEVSPLLNDRSVSALAERYLKPMRDKVGFHHDADVIRRGLSGAPDVPQDFARGSSAAFIDAYYPFADFVAWAYLLDGKMPPGGEEQEIMKAVGEIIDLATRYCAAADAIIGEAMGTLGFTVERD